ADAAACEIVRVGEELDKIAGAIGEATMVLGATAATRQHFEILVARLDADSLPAEVAFEDIARAALKTATCSGFDEVSAVQAREKSFDRPAVVARVMTEDDGHRAAFHTTPTWRSSSTDTSSPRSCFTHDAGVCTAIRRSVIVRAPSVRLFAQPLEFDARSRR